MHETNDYNQACLKLKQAEVNSDLQTKEEEDPIRNSRIRKPDDTSSDDSDRDVHQRGAPKKRKGMPNLDRTSRKSPRRSRPQTLPDLPRLPTPPSAEPSQSTRDEQLIQYLPKQPVEIRSPERAPGMNIEILTCLEQIKAQVHHNSRLLQEIMGKIEGTPMQNVDDDWELPGFPLKEMEQLNTLEDALKDDSAKNQLIRNLGTIGGDGTKQTVRRLLGHLIDHNLALKLNWMGKGEKRAFSTLRLKDVVLKTVRKNRFCSEATNKNIEDVIKDWFRFAKDRSGGRKARRQKNKVAVNAEVNPDSAPDSGRSGVIYDAVVEHRRGLFDGSLEPQTLITDFQQNVVKDIKQY